MTITIDNLDTFGIGHNYSDPIYPQDIAHIVYGADLEETMVTDDPETDDGSVAWWKEPSYQRWWKIGPRGTRTDTTEE